MGLLYDLKQKEYDDGEREFIEQSKPYIEFLDLLQSISDFTKDTPHTVAKFLYEDKEILTLTSYDLAFEPQENTGYYEYDEKLDDYTEIIVSYSEWFFRTFLDFDNIKEFQDELDFGEYCFFKKTDILTLDCLKKIGFVDVSLLEEIDEIERLTRENIEQEKIIEKLSNALSLKTNTTDPTTLQTQLDQTHARIAELEQQLANAPNQATRSQKDEHISELESQTSELKGLALHNHNKAKSKAFAQIIAKSIWDMDKNQQIKTGDMVQYIKGLLWKFDQKNLPQNDETLAGWLKDVKPTYATKSGRIPKDAPNEIPLTFKK